MSPMGSGQVILAAGLLSVLGCPGPGEMDESKHGLIGLYYLY